MSDEQRTTDQETQETNETHEAFENREAHGGRESNSKRESSVNRGSLVERLDPALGEASSGIGVLLSELVRRTLRGGISKIEEEMQDFVDEKVDLTVADRMPAFEEAATRTAEHKARTVADEAVEGVRSEAREAAERLTGEIGQTRDQAFQQLQESSEKLSGEIAQTEERAKNVSDQLSDITQKSQKSYQAVRDELDKLNSNLAEVRGQLQEQMNRHMVQLDARNAQLEARIAELEKPRGLRALWAWFGSLFGGKSKKPRGPQTSEAAGPETSG